MTSLDSTYYRTGIFAGFGATAAEEAREKAKLAAQYRSILEIAYKALWQIESQYGGKTSLTDDWRGYFLGMNAKPSISSPSTIDQLKIALTRARALQSKAAYDLQAAKNSAVLSTMKAPVSPIVTIPPGVPTKPPPGVPGVTAPKPFPVVPVAVAGVGVLGLLGLLFLRRKR